MINTIHSDSFNFYTNFPPENADMDNAIQWWLEHFGNNLGKQMLCNVAYQLIEHSRRKLIDGKKPIKIEITISTEDRI